MKLIKIKEWFMNPYNTAFSLMLIFAVYLRFRFLFQESIWVDETAYYLQALYLLKTFSFGPFTPFIQLRVMPELIIAFWGLFLDLFTAGRMMGLTYAVLGIIFTYLIGKELKNEAIGILAATLVAFNPYIWFHSSRTLIDSPLTTMFIICAYFLIRLERKFDTRNLIYLIIAMALTMQTKYVGALFLFTIILYYLLRFFIIEKNQKDLLHKLLTDKLTYMILIMLAIFLYIIKKWIIGGLNQLTIDTFFLDQIPLMMSEPIMWLAIVGIVISFLYKKKEYLVIVSWAVIYYTAFTIHVAGPYPRYILPGIPAVILLASIGLIELGNFIKPFIKIEKKIISIILVILLLLVTIPAHYETGNSMILRLSYAFTGYDEAGQWIQRNVEDGATVYVMSTSWANLFSENLDDRIQVGNTVEFKTKEHLIEKIKNIDNSFYLIIDNWEAGAQPKWLTPNQENINNIINMGFQLQYIVNKKYPLSNEQFAEIYNKIGIFTLNIDDRSLQEIPAIFIFKRIERKYDETPITADSSI